jgi:hypothetical protein
VQGDREFDDAEIRPEMTAGLGENFDQLIAHFLGELRKVLFAQRLDVAWRVDSIQ